VGETEHVRLCAGHIGFEIKPSHRGRAAPSRPLYVPSVAR
jgi:hypothetical protein